MDLDNASVDDMAWPTLMTGKSIHSYNPAPAATSSIDKEVQETESTTPSKSDVESQSPNFS